MTTGYQIKDQESAYYLTLQIVHWADIFTHGKYIVILLLIVWNIAKKTKV